MILALIIIMAVLGIAWVSLWFKVKGMNKGMVDGETKESWVPIIPNYFYLVIVLMRVSDVKAEIDIHPTIVKYK